MKCPKCGTELPDGAMFCPYCGPIGGDAGGVHDSVVNRSPGAGSVYAPSVNIGREEKKYCPECENLISEKNHLLVCGECKTRFCEHCEGFFRKERKRGEKPYCGGCFEKNQEMLREERKRAEEKVRRAAEEEAKRAEEEQLREEQMRLKEETKTRTVEEATRVENEIVNSIGMKLKLIPAGEFMMGEGSDKHKVTLTKPFYIGVYPVTQREWKAVMGSNPSNFKGDDLPLESVTGDDCHEFIEKLNSMEGGYKYRLPTEAEWEYACRAGSTTEYCYGDDEGRLGEYAWYDGNSISKTHPVGTKRPNAWGLHDMHGNVWEWCEDWYEDWGDIYNGGAGVDPHGPASGELRISRGGSWNNDAIFCSSGCRHDPYLRYSGIGFRLVSLAEYQDAEEDIGELADDMLDEFA